MEKIHEIYGREIWIMILQTVVDNCPEEINSENLNALTKTEGLFSSQIENKLILGRVMIQLFQKINARFEISLKIDYPPKSEPFYFSTLKDIWLYFIERLYEHQEIENVFERNETSNIVPFPRYKPL